MSSQQWNRLWRGSFISLTVAFLALLTWGLYRVKTSSAEAGSAPQNAVDRRLDEYGQIQREHDAEITRNSQRLTELERRFDRLDPEHMQILVEVAALKTIVTTNQKWLEISVGAALTAAFGVVVQLFLHLRFRREIIEEKRSARRRSE